MKIVVVGGNGFIGSHFVARAVDLGHEVSVCDYASTPHVKHGRPFKLIAGSLRELAGEFARYGDVDIVCHLASTTIPSTSNSAVVADIQENLVDTVRLLEAMRTVDCRRLLYISSGGAIYGTPRYTPIDEEHPLNPTSSYGVVKVAVEHYVSLFSVLHGLRPAIVRPSNPYGPGQSGKVGVVSAFLRRLREGKAVTLFGSAETVRDFVYITDLVQLLVQILEKDVTGTFNCGCGVGVSLQELITMISEVTGHAVVTKQEPMRAGDPPAVVLDISRAAAQVGWRPTIPLDVGIARVWRSLLAE